MMIRSSHDHSAFPAFMSLDAESHAGVVRPTSSDDAAAMRHALMRRAGIDEARRRVVAIGAGFPPPPALVTSGALFVGVRRRSGLRRLARRFR